VTSRSQLTAQERKGIRPANKPIAIQTANGDVTARDEVEMYVRKLGMNVTAYLLDNSPNLLSLGKLCKNDGLDYVWKHGEEPYLRKGKGPRIPCPQQNNVPTITAADQRAVQPKGQRAKKKESQKETPDKDADDENMLASENFIIHSDSDSLSSCPSMHTNSDSESDVDIDSDSEGAEFNLDEWLDA